jgi:hypothetical protein
MIERDWKDLMDYVFELDEEVAVIIGVSDIDHKDGYSSLYFKDLTVDSFWKVIGRGDNELILRDALEHWECDVDKEGEYEFKAILKYYKGDYSVGEMGYWEVQHIEFNFIQTFLERERECKLDKILDFDNLFF